MGWTDAAGTKWNFHPYMPGLVGGHCIPVDPYYLVYKAEEVGYHPQVMLAGRAINDYMPKYVAELAIKGINEVGKPIKGSKIVIMGLTYKENVPDTRESPVYEMVKVLREFHADVYGYDPLLHSAEIEKFGLTPLESLAIMADCVIVCVPHNCFKTLTLPDFLRMSDGRLVIVDVKRSLKDIPSLAEYSHYITL